MSLASEFTTDPLAFLEKNAIYVPEETDKGTKLPDIFKFELVQWPDTRVTNLAVLQLHQSGDSIEAYYLPWELGKATTMDLDDKAKFFFTSEMTNCRFSILADNAKKPKVAHVAGNEGMGQSKSNQRTQWEKDAKFVDDLSAGRARRFSISDGRDKKFPAVKLKKHDYVGQGFDKSSAFVFGLRGNDGDWKFYAQVVKQLMIPDVLNKLSSDVEILNKNYAL